MLLSNRLRFFFFASIITYGLAPPLPLPTGLSSPPHHLALKKHELNMNRLERERERETQHPSFIIISLFRTRKQKQKHDGIENYYINFELGILREEKKTLSLSLSVQNGRNPSTFC